MRGFLWCCLGLLFCSVCNAQSEHIQVTLRDSSILKGRLIQESDEAIQLVLITNDTVRILQQEILSRNIVSDHRIIYVDHYNGPRGKTVKRKIDTTIFQRRFFIGTDLSLFSSFPERSDVRIYGGIHLRSRLGLGVEMSWPHFAVLQGRAEVFVLSAQLRTYFKSTSRSSRWYADLSLGYAGRSTTIRRDISVRADESIYANTSLGIQFQAKPIIIYADISVKYIHLRGDVFQIGRDEVIRRPFDDHRFLPAVSLGIAF